MAVSKSTRRTRPGTNSTPESTLRKSNVSVERQRAWKTAQGASGPLRFPAYKQLYLLNVYAERMIGLLKELESTTLLSYHQALIQQVRSEASQNILEKMNGVELTDSFLCDQLRKCFEKILRS